MIKNIACKCGKVLGTRCLETQEVLLSSKALIVSYNYGDIKILCPNCNQVVTEIGKVKK